MNRLKKLGLTSLSVLMLMGGCAGDNESVSEGSRFSPGTYEASAEGYGGTLTIETTFTESEIETIEVVEMSETAGIGDNAIETLTSETLDNQSLTTDVVSGATLSSEEFIETLDDIVAYADCDFYYISLT